MIPPAPSASQIRAIEDLHGPAGHLEAVLNVGRDDAEFAAVVCHPHPPSGGTMHTKAVYHAMKAFSAFGMPVVRFNFRGVGRSDGFYDEGQGEQDDVRATLDWMERNLRLPILLAGFSFGSYVGLKACCGDDRVHGRVGLGLPVRAAGRDYTYEFLKDCPGPKLFISGDHDQFSPRAVMEPMLAELSQPTRMVWVNGADHFFAGVPGSPASKLNDMQMDLRGWLAAEFDLSERSSLSGSSS